MAISHQTIKEANYSFINNTKPEETTTSNSTMLRHMKLKTQDSRTTTTSSSTNQTTTASLLGEEEHHQDDTSRTTKSTFSVLLVQQRDQHQQEESALLHPPASKVSISSALSSCSSSSSSSSSTTRSSSSSVCSLSGGEILQVRMSSTPCRSPFQNDDNNKQLKQKPSCFFVAAPPGAEDSTGTDSSRNSTMISSAALAHISMPPLPNQVSILNKPPRGGFAARVGGPQTSKKVTTILQKMQEKTHFVHNFYGTNSIIMSNTAVMSTQPQNRENETKKRKISIDSITALQKQDALLLQNLSNCNAIQDVVPSIVSVVPQLDETMSRTSWSSSKKRKMQESVSKKKEESSTTSNTILLLARKQDSDHLNPIHCFVRQNIEVFVASEEDITAPCPGRKNTIKAGQVGLRCIHCRNVESRQRAKRAVCYPSTLGRVYNCVSDMKFDHFSLCKYLPALQRDLFNRLRIQKESKSKGKGGNNTSKYYYDTAVEMGMRETFDGMVILDKKGTSSATRRLPLQHEFINKNEAFSFLTRRQRIVSNLSIASSDPSQHQPNASYFKNVTNNTVSYSPVKEKLDVPGTTTSSDDTNSSPCNHLASMIPIFADRRLLATPSDAHYLNPIHCFVRKNVEVFIANEKDVAAPAPGRKKPIMLGQVGIRCIHCQNLPPKHRVKRAICYPPTIASLYHAVSNMKFDHYGACKGLTPQERQSFSDLKAASCRKVGGGGGANRNASANLARYYQQSARSELGLYDTENGIRVMHNSFLVQDYENTGTTRTKPILGTSSLCSSSPPSFAIKLPTRLSSISVGTGVAAAPDNSIARAPLSSPNSRTNPVMDGMSVLMLAASNSRFGRQ